MSRDCPCPRLTTYWTELAHLGTTFELKGHQPRVVFDISVHGLLPRQTRSFHQRPFSAALPQALLQSVFWCSPHGRLQRRHLAATHKHPPPAPLPPGTIPIRKNTLVNQSPFFPANYAPSPLCFIFNFLKVFRTVISLVSSWTVSDRERRGRLIAPQLRLAWASGGGGGVESY